MDAYRIGNSFEIPCSDRFLVAGCCFKRSIIYRVITALANSTLDPSGLLRICDIVFAQINNNRPFKLSQ